MDAGIEASFEKWKQGLLTVTKQDLNGVLPPKKIKQVKGVKPTPSVTESKKKESVEEQLDDDYDYEEEEEEEYQDSDEEEEDGEEEFNEGSDGEVLDLEDLGSMATKIKKARSDKSAEEEAYQSGGAKVRIGDGKVAEPKEMITPIVRKSLTKQGYSLIGTHSGVKICRWTKAMLRGRGGCYKHTFYGIESHRCMETTPSLACANKCVFCWRYL